MMTFLTEHIDYDPLPSDVQAKVSYSELYM